MLYKLTIIGLKLILFIPFKRALLNDNALLILATFVMEFKLYD